MKTKKNFENGVLAFSAFLFASAVVMALYTLLSVNFQNGNLGNQQLAENSGKSITQTSIFDKTDGVTAKEKQILDLSKEIAKLEQKRTKLNNSLEKAKSERNKNYGMVAGLSYQPSQSLNEVINLEKKLNKVDHQLTALNTQKSNLNRQIAMNN